MLIAGIILIFLIFLERNPGIIGVPFGRTELSICGNGTTFHALLHRHGPVGPSFQGMPEKFDFHVFFDFVLKVVYEIVNEQRLDFGFEG